MTIQITILFVKIFCMWNLRERIAKEDYITTKTMFTNHPLVSLALHTFHVFNEAGIVNMENLSALLAEPLEYLAGDTR